VSVVRVLSRVLAGNSVHVAPLLVGLQSVFVSPEGPAVVTLFMAQLSVQQHLWDSISSSGESDVMVLPQ